MTSSFNLPALNAGTARVCASVEPQGERTLPRGSAHPGAESPSQVLASLRPTTMALGSASMHSSANNNNYYYYYYTPVSMASCVSRSDKNVQFSSEWAQNTAET